MLALKEPTLILSTWCKPLHNNLPIPMFADKMCFKAQPGQFQTLTALLRASEGFFFLLFRACLHSKSTKLLWRFTLIFVLDVNTNKGQSRAPAFCRKPGRIIELWSYTKAVDYKSLKGRQQSRAPIY